MRRRKRTRARLIYEMLKVVATEGPMPPTRLSYAVRMPYDRLAEMLRWLEKKGLIKVNDYGTKKEVEITKEGLKALYDLEKALKILERLGLE